METIQKSLRYLRHPTLKMPPYYDLVEGDDLNNGTSITDASEKTIPHYVMRGTPTSSMRARFVGVISLLSIMVLSIPFVWYVSQHDHKILATDASDTLLDCGNSVAEAQAKDCVFDVLDYNWVPAECYDEETAREFRKWLNQTDIEFGPFPFFEELAARHHVDGEIELSHRVGGDGELSTYATQQEHRAHCVFTMKRYVRMQAHPEKRRVPITTSHLEHCLKEVVEALKGPNAWEKGRLGSSFGVGFSTC